MKERPILFSAPMVRAILEGRKTQTRRVVKQDLKRLGGGDFYAFDHKGINYRVNARHTTVAAWAHLIQFCPYGQPGDRLWVRETFGLHAYGDESDWNTESIAGADAQILGSWALAHHADWGPCQDGCHWRPSIHMPRWASRILLEITGVRVERLKDISDADLELEGIQEWIDRGIDHDGYPRDAFRSLWESINGAGSWDANPWVWVIEFKQVGAEQ